MSGYEKFSNGFIVQWGVGPSLGNNVYANIAFPIAFPNQCVGISYAPYNNGVDSIDDDHIVVLNKTSTGFRFVNNDSGTAKPIFWFAYGY